MENANLRAEIARSKKSIAEVAAAIGISPSSLSCKLSDNSERCFTQTEMKKLVRLLHITNAGDVFNLR